MLALGEPKQVEMWTSVFLCFLTGSRIGRRFARAYRIPMAKYFIGVIVIVLVALGAYYAWQMYGTEVAPPLAPAPEEAATLTYATSTFTIAYPSTYSVDDAYAYDQFEGKSIAGVKFTIPESETVGTNLSSDTHLSVESLPRAQNCTGDIYIVPNVKAVDLTVGSTTYSVATSTGAAAGNIYEEQVYAIAGSKPCTAVRYFIHSGNIGDYLPAATSTTQAGPQEGEGAVHEFDRAALLREFDSIRDSLVLSQ